MNFNQKNFEEDIYKYIEQGGLIHPGDAVLAGVSGGTDSVCLLLVLQVLSEKIPFTLSVIHVEHGIRGKAGREDARFTEELCEKYGIPCRVYAVDVPSYAAAQGTGTEEAARILRYEAFAQEAERTGADRIALAHHQGDQAETVLFCLCRGSGLAGLSGMPASRTLSGTDARIIRPLLCTDREGIRQYARARGELWREDLTNRDVRYARNRIRENILPELQIVNEGAAKHIVQTADDLAQIALYLEEAAAAAGEPGTVYEADGIRIDEDCFFAMHPVLQKTWIRRILEEAAGSSRDLTREHTDAVCGLFAGQVGRRVMLPYGLGAVREYDCVRIGKKQDRSGGRTGEGQNGDGTVPDLNPDRSGSGVPKDADRPVFCVPAMQTGVVEAIELPDGHRVFLEVTCFDGNMEKIPQNKYTKWFDYDKIKVNLQVRNRLPGDFLQISTQGGRRKLKDWMIDEKIPAAKRDSMFLLAADAHVLWVFEGRTSEAFRVDEATQQILIVCYEQQNGQQNGLLNEL